MNDNYIDNINKFYNQRMNLGIASKIHQAGYHNLGLWREGCDDLSAAQVNLVKTLMRDVTSRGSVLDVACGNGASCQFFKQSLGFRNVTGINISQSQIKKCQKIAKDCAFLMMDAANLEFDNGSFDVILSIEAAFHFNTREKFLEEAYRVLKDGGQLRMTDCIMSYGNDIYPEANILPSIASYSGNVNKYRI